MFITGKVIHGSGDGTKLGFPTANLELEHEIDLPYGVYTSKININSKLYNGITHYGPRSVFGEIHPQFEVHIFDFAENIYNQTIKVQLIGLLRKTQKFASLEQMIIQINQDIALAKEKLDMR